ncbi:uncharacterized protein ISCGN_000388 [Ixodes scapularis]
MERGFLSEQDGFQSNTGATVDGPAVFARDSGIRPRPIASLAKDRCVQLACAPWRIYKPAKDLTALRPISLTPTICKIYKRILASRINWWLETKGLYHESQIGFRQLVGAEDGLHRLAQDITKVPGRIQWIRSIVATDISKAYDNIHHAAILDAMVNLQFPHGIIKAIHNFLTNRTFSVRVSGKGKFCSLYR